MKSMFWSPTFKVIMGSRGPAISEPGQPYLISKPASPTTVGASSSFLALGTHSSSGPKLGTGHTGLAVTGPGASWGPVEGLSCPWGRGGFPEGPRLTFPEQQLALQISCLFSFVPSGSLAERSLCLTPTSPSPSCQYSPGETGIAWAVRLEPDPGSAGQRLLSPGSEPAEVAALRPWGELAEEQRLLDFTWPWIRH